MENEKYKAGASFIEVLCGECPSKIGAKTIHSIHKGYESQGALPVTPQELSKAQNIALEHERRTKHSVRVIEGQLEGRIYPNIEKNN